MAPVLVLLACAKEAPPLDTGSTERVVGVHRIALVEPESWQHFDHGLEHLYRKDLEIIGVKDLGFRLSPGEEGGATIDEWIERALPELGFDGRRAIASREGRTLEGREVVIVDTWDRLTHEYRRRFAFYWNDGHLLVLYSRMGRWETIRPALEGMIDTLVFVDDESVTRHTSE